MIAFRRRGVPLGSGAIESAIRRVINLRLKGNSISWYEENAEGMLVFCMPSWCPWENGHFFQYATLLVAYKLVVDSLSLFAFFAPVASGRDSIGGTLPPRAASVPFLPLAGPAVHARLRLDLAAWQSASSWASSNLPSVCRFAAQDTQGYVTIVTTLAPVPTTLLAVARL